MPKTAQHALQASFFLLLAAAPSLRAQEDIYVGLQSTNNDKSVYTAMQNIWFANESISYLCPLPFIEKRADPVVPLREGEGKRNWHILEGSLLHQLPYFLGRNQSNHAWQTWRLTLDFGFNLRMLQDSSSPLIPNNNIFGASVQKILWNSHTDRKVIRNDKMHYTYQNWYDLQRPLQTLSLDFSARHYSNGQPPGFYYTDTVNGAARQRNDYRKGDFSTNYLRTGLTYSRLSGYRRNLLSANLAYQWDGTIGGPLDFSAEQEQSYGHHRLLSFVQYRHTFTRRRSRLWTGYSVCDDKLVALRLRRWKELVVRLESELILDDVSRYASPDGHMHRFNNHLYLQYGQYNWRALGLVLHVYEGRDYSNIRYDMPIYAVMAGISVAFNKYYQPFSACQRYRVRGRPACDPKTPAP